MFSEISRYTGLSEVVAPDVKGRMLKSCSLRLLPQVTAEVLHNLEDKDRLDTLGSTYYKEPGKWWRFCDANTPFLSPSALLGAEPVVTTTFVVSYANNAPDVNAPWYKVIQKLRDLSGVHKVLYERKVEIEKKIVPHAGRTVEVHSDRFTSFLTVTYNRLSVTSDQICNAIQATVETDPRFIVESYQTEGRTGKNILIPPDIIE